MAPSRKQRAASRYAVRQIRLGNILSKFAKELEVNFKWIYDDANEDRKLISDLSKKYKEMLEQKGVCYKPAAAESYRIHGRVPLNLLHRLERNPAIDVLEFGKKLHEAILADPPSPFRSERIYLGPIDIPPHIIDGIRAPNTITITGCGANNGEYEIIDQKPAYSPVQPKTGLAYPITLTLKRITGE